MGTFSFCYMEEVCGVITKSEVFASPLGKVYGCQVLSLLPPAHPSPSLSSLFVFPAISETPDKLPGTT